MLERLAGKLSSRLRQQNNSSISVVFLEYPVPICFAVQQQTSPVLKYIMLSTVVPPHTCQSTLALSKRVSTPKLARLLQLCYVTNVSRDSLLQNSLINVNT